MSIARRRRRSSTIAPRLPTKCPGCEYEQVFNLRLRVANGGRWKERFIACQVCPWKRVLGVTTDSIERLRRQVGDYERRSRYEREKYGQAQSSTAQGLQRVKRRLRDAEIALAKEMRR